MHAHRPHAHTLSIVKCVDRQGTAREAAVCGECLTGLLRMYDHEPAARLLTTKPCSPPCGQTLDSPHQGFLQKKLGGVFDDRHSRGVKNMHSEPHSCLAVSAKPLAPPSTLTCATPSPQPTTNPQLPSPCPESQDTHPPWLQSTPHPSNTFRPDTQAAARRLAAPKCLCLSPTAYHPSHHPHSATTPPQPRSDTQVQDHPSSGTSQVRAPPLHTHTYTLLGRRRSLPVSPSVGQSVSARSPSSEVWHMRCAHTGHTVQQVLQVASSHQAVARLQHRRPLVEGHLQHSHSRALHASQGCQQVLNSVNTGRCAQGSQGTGVRGTGP